MPLTGTSPAIVVRSGGGGGGGGASSRFQWTAGPGAILPSGTDAPVEFDSTQIDWDDQGWCNTGPTNTVFTCPADGTYLFVAWVEIGPVPGGSSGWGAWAQIQIYNGDPNDWDWETVNTSVANASIGALNPDMCLSGVHKMNVGDTMSVQAEQWSGSTLSVVYASLAIVQINSTGYWRTPGG